MGDGSQPLHTTIHYDGWASPANPNGYSTAHGIHWRFEGTYVSPAGANIQAAEVAAQMTPVKPISGDIFDAYVAYLRQSATYVDRVYALDKVGAFEKAGTPESRAFTDERLAAGASMLRDMIYSAWVDSAVPVVDKF